MTTLSGPYPISTSSPRAGLGLRAWLLRIDLVLLTLLGVGTGAVKLARMPEEMALFAKVGFSDPMTIAYGVVQIAFALLLVPKGTRRLGAALLIPTFAFATYALFVSAVHPFSVLSLLFIAMAAVQLPKSET